MLVHPKLLMLARLGLGLGQEDVAAAANIGLRSLQRLESFDHATTTIQTVNAVQSALENYGVVFLGEDEKLGPGFRLPRKLFQREHGAPVKGQSHRVRKVQRTRPDE